MAGFEKHRPMRHVVNSTVSPLRTGGSKLGIYLNEPQHMKKYPHALFDWMIVSQLLLF
jgi:hypothetical protein